MALVVDPGGIVRESAFRDPSLLGELDAAERWSGRRWRSTVTAESRPKLDALLSAAVQRDHDPTRWRHLNHPARNGGPDVAISYAAVPVGDDGTVVVLGRDLRANAALQQRLVEAQQALEREHDDLRCAEARFRALFEAGTDALVLLDGHTGRATGLNPAARDLLGMAERELPQSSFPDLFDLPARPGLAALLDAALHGAPPPAPAFEIRHPGPEALRATLRGIALLVSITMLAIQPRPLLLARLRPDAGPGSGPGPGPGPGMTGVEPVGRPVPAPPSALPALVEAMPDAVALCDADGDVVAVNAAFRAMAALPEGRTPRGEPLSNWIGNDPVDLSVLLSNLQRHDSVRMFGTVLRPELGGRRAVEIAGMRVPAPFPAAPPAASGGFALFLRDISRRLPAPEPVAGGESARRMKALIGRVSLKELVREATDAIERLCIEDALEMTGNNRASAAEMLGVSRQSLYVKLRRYGMGGPEDGSDDGPVDGADDGRDIVPADGKGAE